MLSNLNLSFLVVEKNQIIQSFPPKEAFFFHPPAILSTIFLLNNMPFSLTLCSH